MQLSLSEDNSTSTSFVDIFLDDVYGLHFFKNNTASVNRIVDIGANQGLFSVAASNLYTADIHAYEPNAAVMQSLMHNTAHLNVTCFNEAVGLTNGKITMEEGKDSLHGKAVLSNTGSIFQTSLKNVCERIGGNIDLLKLDCEGAEWEILKNTTTLRAIGAITMEYHTDEIHQHHHIKTMLMQAGFEVLHHEMSGPTWGIVWSVNNAYNF